MKPKFVKLAQRILNESFASRLVVDGIFGPKSIRAASDWAGLPRPAGTMTPARWVARVVQRAANRSELVPHKVLEDAFWGPVTEDAAYRLLGEKFDRPDKPSDTPAGEVRCWTPTDAQMIRKFGNPGSNQVITPLPYPVKLAWDTSTVIVRASMHRMAAANITGALEAIRDAYGMDRIHALRLNLFGGILNVRKKRGGKTWSSHAWGTAIDLDPDHNRLAWKRDRAAFAREPYRAMRDAFRDNGLMSLGECYDFDWMHWQVNP
jgi:hypothetical protein